MYRTLSAPIFVHLETTRVCNLRCRHCYNGERTSGCKVDTSDVPNPMAVAEEIIEAGIFSVCVTGGEPLLALDDWRDALLMMRDAGVRMSLNSNLTLFNDHHASTLRDLGVQGILTSLMSHDRAHHDYLAGHSGAQEKTLRGIKAALEAGFHVSANMVCTKPNLADVRGTAELVKGLGIKSFCVTKATRSADRAFADQQLDMSELQQMLRDMLWVRDELGLDVDTLEPLPACCFEDSETRSAFGRRQCNAGVSSGAISAGRILPCPHFSEYGSTPIAASGIKAAWQAMTEWRSKDSRPAECHDCAEFPRRCVGGCRASACGDTGSMSGLDPYSLTGDQIAEIVYEPQPQRDLSAETVLKPINIKFRAEDGFHVAYANAQNWLLVDQKLHDLLARESFTVNDLAQAYGQKPEQVQATANTLLNKGLTTTK